MNQKKVLLGYIEGPFRLESCTNEVRWHFPLSQWLINQSPYTIENETYFITPIQKKSKFGFLLTWPFGFHIWYTFKEQQMDANDEWIPGTEIVAYGRTPGYRSFCPVTWTWGYLGLHWD